MAMTSLVDGAAPDARAAARIGAWAARLCMLFSLAYVLAQLAEWLGWLGSAGGPHSPSTALGLGILLTPSLLLGPAFVALVVGIHHCSAVRDRAWTQLALVFAVMYATFTGLVYYVQLTFVLPHLARGDTAGIALLLFQPFDSFLYAVDMLGYSLMSVATLCLAPVFRGQGPERWIRRALRANGCLLPFLALQMYFPPLIWGGSLWAVTFPVASGLLAVHFGRLRSEVNP